MLFQQDSQLSSSISVSYYLTNQNMRVNKKSIKLSEVLVAAVCALTSFMVNSVENITFSLPWLSENVKIIL